MSRILEYTRINEYLPHKEKTCFASKGVWPYVTIKPKDPQEKVCTISLKVIISNIVGALFWLNLRRVFGRYHTGTLCKVFFCVGQVWYWACWNCVAHWWFFRHHQTDWILHLFYLLLDCMDNLLINVLF